MIEYIFYFVIIVMGLIFLSCALLGIYLIILLILSRGFKISPTVTSNGKSIVQIAKCIEKYIDKTDKKKIKVLDIGSGYGTMLFKINRHLKKKISKKGVKVEFVGYEISKLVNKIAQIRNQSDNIKLIRNDINNLKDFNFDIVITFIHAKQQKLFLDIYRKFPAGTTIIANSLPIPFSKEDSFKLVQTIKVHYRWNIYIYKN